MTITIRVIAALLALFAAGASHAQTAPPNYPSRQVRVIVAYPPGGPTDVIARLVAQKMQEHLGGSVLCGKSARCGWRDRRRHRRQCRPPTGHTLFITTNDFAVGATTSKLSYDPVKNFAPISIVSSSPQVVIANPTLPVKDLRELVALARSRTGQVQLRQHEHRLRPVDHRTVVQAWTEGRHDPRAVSGRCPADHLDARRAHTSRFHRAAAGRAADQGGQAPRRSRSPAPSVSPEFPDVPTTTRPAFPARNWSF